MEDIPPSYDKINANVLDLLPPYLSTASLVKLCLVSKSYYTILIPHLWGSPASHFVQVASESARTTNGINFGNIQVSGIQNDMVYVALTRFKRILRRARLSTRMLCHTLHLPPALSEIYGGPNSTWLREVLDWLPGLQSLCVSGLPFFDHDSLVAVDQSRHSSIPSNLNDDDFRRYPVKLLLAAKEPNVTWAGLSLLMPHLPYLVYLDLSYTSPARNTNVLRSLDALTHLQVLKLRGIGLKDNELEVLANVIGLRVRLLDIAENQLSDMAVRSLLQACVWLPSTPPNEQYTRRHLESWPVGLPPPPDSLSLDTIRTLELDEALLNQLTHPLTGRLAFEDIPHGGITHLFISDNPGVTIESIRSILDTGRLHVLDAGNIAAMTAVDIQVLAARRYSAGQRERESIRAQLLNAKTRDRRGLPIRNRSRPSSAISADPEQSREDQEFDEAMLRLPGAEKLVPVLQEKASKNLTHLRIDYALVTAVLDPTKELREKDKAIANRVELPGVESQAIELDPAPRPVIEAVGSKVFASEMPIDNAIFEMDATPAIPRSELPGDIIHFAISPPIGDTPMENIKHVMSPIRGEGAMAPEVVNTGPPPSDDEAILDAAGSGLRRSATSATNSTVSTLQSSTTASSYADTAHVERPAPLQIRKSISSGVPSSQQAPQSAILHYAEMKKLMNLRPKKSVTKLHPSSLPHLRTLILTNLPVQVPSSSPVITNLMSYIAACAAETRLALLQAQTNYSLPPGRARQDAERQHARTLFALRAIVLEINPEPITGQQRGWKHTGQRLNALKSSTGDPDSEALWSAADNDFSFFGEEGEESAECGVYDQEPDKYYPTTIPYDDKIVVTDNSRLGSSPNVLSPIIGSPTNGASSALSPASRTSVMRNGTTMQSPRNLPLGRNRRISNDMQRGQPTPSGFLHRPSGASGYVEMPGSMPARRPVVPTSNPIIQASTTAPSPAPDPMLDVVSELAKWRRDRKAAYQEELLKHTRRLSNSGSTGSGRLAEVDIYVDGYWSGEVKVVRNAKKNVPKGKMERQGNVDIYGNYFEGGYLYP